MTREKTRLTQLASRMEQGEKKKRGNVEVNPPYGERGDFRRLSVMLSPEAYEMLMRESFRRKIAGEPDHVASAIIREAVIAYLHKP